MVRRHVPAGLFRSEDGGATWQPVAGFNDHPMRAKWVLGGTPDGEFLHSIIVDPRDPAAPLRRACPAAACSNRTDGGSDWAPLNEGCAADFLPDPKCRSATTRTACGYPQQPGPPLSAEPLRHLSPRPSGQRWVRIGKNMPKKIGDIGFPMVAHPRERIRRGCSRWTAPTCGRARRPTASRRLRHARRRRDMAAAGRGPADERKRGSP